MRIEFDETQSPPKRALAVSFDLTGFSTFCSRHDAHVILPRLIAAVFKELNNFLHGGFTEFLAPPKWEEATTVVAPNFLKYTGDGAIMLWFVSENSEIRQRQSTLVVRVLRAFQESYPEKAQTWERDWGMRGLPKSLRIGIAAGHVFELKGTVDNVLPLPVVDYAGYCINLAVRLQNHCRETPFLIHEVVSPQIDGLHRLTAVKMKGVFDEEIYLYESDLGPDCPDFRKKFKAAKS